MSFLQIWKRMTNSVWDCVEFDAISRDFDYATYLNYHTRCACTGKPLSKEGFKLLVQAFHKEYQLDNESDEQTLSYP